MKRKKRDKRKVKIAAVSLLIIKRTRIQLPFKGYDRDERNIIMTLSAQEIDEHVSLAPDIDISKWNRMKTKSIIWILNYMQKTTLIKKKLSLMLISFIQTIIKPYAARGLISQPFVH